MFLNSIQGPCLSIITVWHINSLPRSEADFCLWGSPKANGVVGDIEAVVVAYCTKPGHGTRLIPPGTLTAVYVQTFTDTSSYWLTSTIIVNSSRHRDTFRLRVSSTRLVSVSRLAIQEWVFPLPLSSVSLMLLM